MTKTAEYTTEYWVDRIIILSQQHKLIMGSSLDHRILRYLQGHGLPINDDRCVSIALYDFPVVILEDLAEKIRVVLESEEVSEKLRSSPPSYLIDESGDEEFTFDYEYEYTLEDDCEDF